MAGDIGIETAGGRITLTLPGDMGLAAAPALADALRHAFTAESEIRVAASAVERVSSAAIQALVAASRLAAVGGQRFTVAGASEILSESCADLGLDDWLVEWSVA
jgi:anti-anti-sigma regulatory factor